MTAIPVISAKAHRSICFFAVFQTFRSKVYTLSYFLPHTVDTAAQIMQMTSRTALAIQEVLKPSILIFDRMSPISSKARLMNIATLTSAAANGGYSKYLGALSYATKSSSNAPITKRAMIIGEFSFAYALIAVLSIADAVAAFFVVKNSKRKETL